MRSKLRVLAVVPALALVVSACADNGSDATGTEDAPRTIEISALDELAYEPSSVEIAAGETVRFVVTNDGETDHEFVVGDAAMQETAEEQAMEGMHGHVEAMASLSLGPGETAEATVTFPESGEYSYACHLTGHFDAGMIGTITVA